MDFEKLGLFYLGRRVDRRDRRGDRRAAALRRRRSGHARRDPRHDRQRQDRARHRADRRSGDRRRAGAGDRSQGRPLEPAADVSRTAAAASSRRGSIPTKRGCAGMTPDAFAEREAARWREGLAEWGQSADRIARLRAGGGLRRLHARQPRGAAAVDPAHVPGAGRGHRRRSGAARRARVGRGHEPADAGRHRRRAAAQPRAHPGLDAAHGRVAAAAVARSRRRSSRRCSRRRSSASACSTSSRSSRPPIASSSPSDLNRLLAAPDFAVWLEGEPLDINALLYTPPGKPRVTVLSIAHLDDRERMFFVSLLLNEIVVVDARCSAAPRRCARWSTSTRSRASCRRSRCRRRSRRC